MAEVFGEQRAAPLLVQLGVFTPSAASDGGVFFGPERLCGCHRIHPAVSTLDLHGTPTHAVERT